jgi:hypothetical protein
MKLVFQNSTKTAGRFPQFYLQMVWAGPTTVPPPTFRHNPPSEPSTTIALGAVVC